MPNLSFASLAVIDAFFRSKQLSVLAKANINLFKFGYVHPMQNPICNGFCFNFRFAETDFVSKLDLLFQKQILKQNPFQKLLQ